jgi:nucleotide-binding universal stress UspA family protein
MTTRNNWPVVVGVDGSESALAAVRWAATVAQRNRVRLRLVHTYEMPIGLQTGAADKDEPVLDALRDQGRRWLAEAREAVAEVDPDLPTETVLGATHIVPALLHESETASMVVLGTRELGALRGLLVGCTSVAVAGQARSPVVVVRGRDADSPPRDTGPVVVGVDGTEVSEAAIAFAFAEASARAAELVAVHTWTESLVDLALAGNNAVIDLEVLHQQAEEALAERLAGWQEKYPDVHIQRDVIHDRPNRALRRCSSTAQLVVVGRRSRSSFASLLLGSTSQHLLHHAWGPVAVVAGDDRI